MSNVFILVQEVKDLQTWPYGGIDMKWGTERVLQVMGIVAAFSICGAASAQQGHGTALLTAPKLPLGCGASPAAAFAPPGERFFCALPLTPLQIGDESGIANFGIAMMGSPAPRERDPSDPPETPINPQNPFIPAGFTFFGQFLDHDITKTEPCAHLNDETCNVRTGSLDLDSVYGVGFEDSVDLLVDLVQDGLKTYRQQNKPADPATCQKKSPATERKSCEDQIARQIAQHKAIPLYEVNDEGKPTGRLRIDETDGIRDLPRNKSVEAIIGDPRNDENSILAQLHLKFLEAHNILYEQKRKLLRVGPTQFNRAAFEYARRTLSHHYQAIIRDDYLARTLNDRNRSAILTASFPEDFYYYPEKVDGTEMCGVDTARMPLEFAAAAFRFGHSQVREKYKLNDGQPISIADLFVPATLNDKRKIQWKQFFETDVSAIPSPSTSIDTVMSPALDHLTQPGIPLPCGPGESPNSKNMCDNKPVEYREVLASRNIDTGHHTSRGVPLPSGLTVARELRSRAKSLRVQSVVPADLQNTYLGRRLTADQRANLNDLPLWAYVLAEAEVQERGTRLGDIGSIIVGETFMALLSCDERSILSEAWTPTLPSRKPGKFTLADLINFVESNEMELAK